MIHTVSRHVLQALIACTLVVQTSTAGATTDSLQLVFGPAPFSEYFSGDTVTFECSSMPLLSSDDVVATGGCGGDIDISFGESVSIPTDPVAAGHLSVMTCNFTGTDPCGNVATLSINVRIIDSTPPILQDVPSDLSLPAGRPIPSPAAVYAIDNCSRNLEVELSEIDASTSNFKQVIRTWSVSDESGNTSTASQQITVALPASGGGCENELFGELARTIETTNCENGVEVCLPFAIHADGLLLVDNNPSNYFSCAADTLTAYSVEDLMPDSGTYEVIWNVSPGAYRYRTNSLDSLIAFMRYEQPSADWKLDDSKTEIIGFANPRYEELQTISAATGAQYEAQPKQVVISSRSTIVLIPGVHKLTYRRAECVDTATVQVICKSVLERNITAIQGIDATHSLPFAGSADQYEVNIIEDNLAGLLEIQSIEGPKINFSTLLAGQSSLLLDLCHLPTGSCDRYQLRFEIVASEDVKPPSAARDLFIVAYNGQRMVNILANDQIIGEVSELSITSETAGEVRIDALNRLHYTAPKDWCGEDLVSYEVCNRGGCDTATAVIQVTCEELFVFNGFSPNHDGLNDHFTIVGIENFPNNKLVVFNQHGHQVYAQSAYNNQWDGTYNGSPILDGTYYYVLSITGEGTKSGYVQIKR